MKKLFTLFLSLTLLVATPITTHVTSDSGSSIAMHLKNGYYVTVAIEYSSAPSSYYSSSKTVSGSKTYTIKNSSGTAVATYKLSGTFKYSSRSATCTSASYTTNISNNYWHFTSASASKSGAAAKGSFTAQCKQFGVVIDTISETLFLTCDTSGRLS